MDKLVQKKNEENGFQRFYSVKLKKINFYKFILVYWRMRKKNGYNFFFFGVFQSSSKMKKKNVYMFLGDFPAA